MNWNTITALSYLAKNDPIMKRLIEQYKKPLFTKHVKYYEELVSSIISQQLSVKAASTIQKRFCALWNRDEIPPAHDILTMPDEKMREAGLSRQKISYIKDLAYKTENDEIDFKALEKANNEQIIEELTKVKGIGVWTVHMFLIFCMNRRDVLPVGDLGIRIAVGRLYGLGQVASPSEVRTVSETHHWAPYESVAAWYLWRSLENK